MLASAYTPLSCIFCTRARKAAVLPATTWPAGY
jgi:hypothetical protein